jgi:hypothetical protein
MSQHAFCMSVANRGGLTFVLSCMQSHSRLRVRDRVIRCSTSSVHAV